MRYMRYMYMYLMTICQFSPDLVIGDRSKTFWFYFMTGNDASVLISLTD